VSGFASQQPDGLEWSAARATGGHEIAVPGEDGHRFLAMLQRRMAVLPDYGFRGAGDRATAARLGTSVAGLAGGLITLALALGLGFWLRPRTPQR
jgi:cobalt/nickel transport system permease protein